MVKAASDLHCVKTCSLSLV